MSNCNIPTSSVIVIIITYNKYIEINIFIKFFIYSPWESLERAQWGSLLGL